MSFRGRRRGAGRVRRRRFGRAGCLLWIVAAILIVLLLSILSGGFRLGTHQGLGGTRISVAGLARAPAG